MCWTRAGVHVPPVNNPATLFRALFVTAPQDERQRERQRLSHRGSVLDALRESATALSTSLNAADRNKLDQYLTSVRDVERRLQMSQLWIDRPKPKAPIDEIMTELTAGQGGLRDLIRLIVLSSVFQRNGGSQR